MTDVFFCRACFGHLSQTMSHYWRANNMSYLKYVNIASALVRRVLKEPFKTKAKVPRWRCSCHFFVTARGTLARHRTDWPAFLFYCSVLIGVSPRSLFISLSIVVLFNFFEPLELLGREFIVIHSLYRFAGSR